MKVSLPIHVMFLFFIFLYFSSSENAFCHANSNNHLTTPKNSTINRPKNCGNCTDLSIFNVLDYGAKGDGVTDDAKAFGATWDIACKTKGGVMLVPSGFTFLLQTIYFDGIQCQPNIVVQLEGKIVAPLKEHWVKPDMQWILFKNVTKGITITGGGVIDGFGDSWWKNETTTDSNPHAIRIGGSSNITISGITMQNGPKMHIYIEYSQNISIYNFTVRSPGDSPNTDCIHISRARHVRIYNTTLACGDDCVSIQTGSSDVKIYDVECGPGHGYSIGGLGPKKGEAHVSDVSVFNSSLHDTLTGVRIKTWPGGYGTVQNIVFSNITMSNVGTPIVIDQYYCGGHKICNETDTKNALAISHVTFKDISGTYSYKPVSLACSHINPCRNLAVATVDLVRTPPKKAAEPICICAYGRVLTNTTPPLDDCLEPQGVQLPAGMAPTPSPAVPLPFPSPAIAPAPAVGSPVVSPTADPPRSVLMKRMVSI